MTPLTNSVWHTMLIKKLLATLPLLTLSACSAINISLIDPADTLREFRQDIISSSNLSPVSTQALRSVGLTQEQAIEEGVDESVKRQFESFADPVERSYIESELAIGRAQLLERKNPHKAVALYLHAADMAYQGFFLKECTAPVDLRCDSFKVFYERSTRGILEYLKRNGWRSESTANFDTGVGRKFSLAISRSNDVEDPNEYASIETASSFGLEGLTNRHRRSGIGVALVACRARRDDSALEQYLPRVGTCLPLTAIVRMPDRGCQGAVCQAKLEIINSTTTENYQTEYGTIPLAADFTAPLASIVQRTGIGGWDGLFDALSGNEDLLKNTGFYTLEPHNSGKIPLITVHGLFSNPLTWLDIHNELMGDPVIRQHFRVWHYLYPTGLPILENAKNFRANLDQLNNYISTHQPSGSKAPGMVIVGHSMGGILTRTSIVKDSQPLLEYYLEDPSRVKTLSKENQEMVSGYLDFKRKPYVDRAIFVAVPHRGSEIADNWIGRIGRSLLSLPKTVLQKTVSVAKEARNIVRPGLRTSFDGSEASSISGLSAKSPALQGLSRTTIDPAVPFHSIIGDRGDKDTLNSSDGVVAYSSSHVDGAQSELLVPADHTAHAHPQAALEIRRILRLHVEQKTPAKPAAKKAKGAAK